MDHYTAKGWGVRILPYIEQLELGDRYGEEFGTLGIYGPTQIDLGLNRIKIFICPSDQQDELIWVGSTANTYTNHPEGIMFYTTNAGGVADTQSAWEPGLTVPVIHGDGMMLNIESVRIRDVFDGTSNTLMVGEVTGDESGTNNGHQWVHYTLFSTVEGINGPTSIPGSGVFNYGAGKLGSRPRDTFSSYHPGGAHFQMVDGSVQFLSEFIDQDVSKRPNDTRRWGANIRDGLVNKGSDPAWATWGGYQR